MGTHDRNKENRGLPARWRMKGSTYYYRVPPGAEAHWDGKVEYKLGNSLAEAHHVYAQKIAEYDNEPKKTINGLLDAYIVEKLPTLSKKAQTDQPYLIKPLRAVFGHMPLDELKPSHCYEYIDKSKSKSTAAHAVQVLSSSYSLAIQKGWMDRHPIRGQVRIEKQAKQKQAIEDWEIDIALSLRGHQKRGGLSAVQAYIKLKLLIGARRIDILRLTESDLKDDGIHLTPSKTAASSGASIVIEWTDELREAIKEVKEARPVDISPFLFCNRSGESYIDEMDGDQGWKSAWKRFNEKLKEKGITRAWTEALLRSRCALDADSLDHAKSLLAHSDSRTTKRFYRQKAEIVSPVKKKKAT